MKIRLKWLLILGAIPLGLLGLYVVVVMGVGLMPTGYRQAEARWTAEAKKMEADHVAQARATNEPTATSATLDVVRPKADQKASTPTVNPPRKSFASCWEAFLQATQSLPDPRKSPQAVDPRITSVLLDFISRHNGRQGLAPRGSLPFSARPSLDEAEVRKQLAEPMRRAAERLEGKLVGDNPQISSVFSWAFREDDVSTKVFAPALSASPHPAADQLLHLPPNAVPLLPEGPPINGFSGWTQMATLGQAWLYALAHEPNFDAALGLRRLYELQCYLGQAVYPRQTPANLNHLVILAARCDLVDSRTCQRIAGELMRLDQEERSDSYQVMVRRHQAKVMHGLMSEMIEKAYGGAKINDNAFSFFFDGKLERLWFKANHGLVRRKIDQFTLAMAEGDVTRIQSAGNDLVRAVRMANLHPDFWKQRVSEAVNNNLRERSYLPISHYLADALELALWCHRRDRGRLPERVADLFPGYLPESARRQVLDGQVWVIQDHPRHPVLWHVAQRPERRPTIVEIDQATREVPERFERAKGRPMTTKERAEFERQFDEMRRQLADPRTVKRVMEYSGTILF